MKKYFKIDNLEEAGVLHHVEFDGEWVTREVNFYDRDFYEHKGLESEWELSINGEDLSFKGWSLSYLDFSEEDRISSDEFEQVWQQALKVHLKKNNNKVQSHKIVQEPKELTNIEKPPTQPNIKRKKQISEGDFEKFWEDYWQKFPDTTYRQGKDLIISGTEDTPTVHFDQNNAYFLIKGKSLLYDSGTFYAKLDAWLDGYLKYNPDTDITLALDFEYINTHGYSSLIGLIVNISNNKGVKINWHFETEDQEDQGLDMADMFDIPFFLINNATGEKYQA